MGSGCHKKDLEFFEYKYVSRALDIMGLEQRTHVRRHSASEQIRTHRVWKAHICIMANISITSLEYAIYKTCCHFRFTRASIRMRRRFNWKCSISVQKSVICH